MKNNIVEYNDTILVCVNSEMKKDIVNLATKKRVSLSHIVRQSIIEYLDKNTDTKKCREEEQPTIYV